LLAVPEMRLYRPQIIRGFYVFRSLRLRGANGIPCLYFFIVIFHSLIVAQPRGMTRKEMAAAKFDEIILAEQILL